MVNFQMSYLVLEFLYESLLHFTIYLYGPYKWTFSYMYIISFLSIWTCWLLIDLENVTVYHPCTNKNSLSFLSLSLILYGRNSYFLFPSLSFLSPFVIPLIIPNPPLLSLHHQLFSPFFIPFLLISVSYKWYSVFPLLWCFASNTSVSFSSINFLFCNTQLDPHLST